MARAGHGRVVEAAHWAHPPRWLQALTRHGPGPLGLTTFAIEAYGLGLAILGVAAAALGDDRGTATFLLACWLLGGIVVLVVTDTLLTLRSRRR